MTTGLSKHDCRTVIFSDDPAERRTFLLIAAEDGHYPPTFEYAMQCDEAGERRRWLR